MLRPLVSVLLIQMATLPAKDVYYLDVHSQGVIAAVTLNGYPLWEVANTEGQAFSSFVSPNLHSGKNELKVEFQIPEDDSRKLVNPWLDCQIVKAPADHLRTADAPGEVVLKKRYEPEELRKLSSSGAEEIKILSGSTPDGGGLFYFDSVGERRWSFGVQLTDKAKSLFQRPRAIEISGITDSLVFGEVHLRNSRNGDHLAYHKLKFLRGGEQVLLPSNHLSKGVSVLEGGEFDTLWVFGMAAEGVTDLRSLDVKLFQIPQPVSETIEFEVKLNEKWQCDQAMEIEDLSAEVDSLIEFLASLHRTINQEPVDQWLPFFEVKLQDLSMAMGQPKAQLAASQKSYFEDLKAIKSWALEPFDAERLIFNVVNTRVVAASYIDSEGPIISVPLIRPGQNQPDRFKIPLYLAKLNGAWTIVR